MERDRHDKDIEAFAEINNIFTKILLQGENIRYLEQDKYASQLESLASDIGYQEPIEMYRYNSPSITRGEDGILRVDRIDYSPFGSSYNAYRLEVVGSRLRIGQDEGDLPFSEIDKERELFGENYWKNPSDSYLAYVLNRNAERSERVPLFNFNKNDINDHLFVEKMIDYVQFELARRVASENNVMYYGEIENIESLPDRITAFAETCRRNPKSMESAEFELPRETSKNEIIELLGRQGLVSKSKKLIAKVSKGRAIKLQSGLSLKSEKMYKTRTWSLIFNS